MTGGNMPNVFSRGTMDALAPYYADEQAALYHGDARAMEWPVTGLIVTDPPYGVTDHDWDVVVPADEWMRGEAAIVFAAEPYASALVANAPLRLAYDLVWVKNTASNAFSAAFQPMREHERILIFGKPTYYPQMVPRSAEELSRLNAQQRRENPAKYSGTVLAFDAVNNRNAERTAHPSQKPVELLHWLIRAYSSPGALIIDPFAGSGTTLRAAKDLGRVAVGIEREEAFCRIAATRCAQDVLNLEAA